MSLGRYKQVQVISGVELPASTGCIGVTLCLTDAWADKTVTGLPILFGRVIACGQKEVEVTYCGDIAVQKCDGNLISTLPKELVKVYTIEVDSRDQFLNQDDHIRTEDVVELIPFSCHIQKLTEKIASVDVATQDWVVDYDNVSIDNNPGAGTFIVTFPIIDRIGNTPITEFTVDFSPLYGSSVATLTANNATSTLVFDNGATVTNIDACDLIEACFNGTIQTDGSGNLGVRAATQSDNILQITSGGALYVPDPVLSGITITSSESAACPGQPSLLSGLSTSGTNVLTSSVGEHTSLTQTAYFGDQFLTTPAEIAALSSGKPTIYFASAVFTNPSPCRSMDYLVVAPCSFAMEATPGSGGIIVGHSLFVEGAAVAAVDGRILAGYNLAISTHSGVLEDYTLPTITYSGILNPGQSVTIGVDFGLSTVFPSTGTITTLAIESRAISLIGSTN